MRSYEENDTPFNTNVPVRLRAAVPDGDASEVTDIKMKLLDAIRNDPLLTLMIIGLFSWLLYTTHIHGRELGELRSEIGSVRTEIGAVRTELKTEIRALAELNDHRLTAIEQELSEIRRFLLSNEKTDAMAKAQ